MRLSTSASVNFLVLHKAGTRKALRRTAAAAHSRGATRHRVHRARSFRLADYRTAEADGGAEARAAVAALSGRALFLPLAAVGRVPFLRLLAWKAVSALRDGAEADEGAAAAIPPEIDIDATLSRGRDSHGQGFAELSVGLVLVLARERERCRAACGCCRRRRTCCACCLGGATSVRSASGCGMWVRVRAHLRLRVVVSSRELRPDVPRA